MSTYLNLNIEPEVLKIKRRDDEIKNWNIKRKNMIMRIY